jgi:predicted NUDIX family NTP pyrophosphohydrolase
MYRRRDGAVDVLLAHPGGPFFAGKDEGAWTIPKGEIEAGEEAEAAARREFAEETGVDPPGPGRSLGEVRQRGGKLVQAWAVEAPAGLVPTAGSSTFTLEWPPRSGRRQVFPEVDRLEFCDLQLARRRINPAQVAFLDRLVELLGDG